MKSPKLAIDIRLFDETSKKRHVRQITSMSTQPIQIVRNSSMKSHRRVNSGAKPYKPRTAYQNSSEVLNIK